MMIVVEIRSESEVTEFSSKKYNSRINQLAGINYQVMVKELHTHPPYNGKKFDGLHGKW